ncbi:hypothetical protein BH18ACT1_BH18ACT1_06220 [soil metagenome]
MTPVEVARAFLDAVLWGEHSKVWELLDDTARRTVLQVATRGGLGAVPAARMREGTASSAERDRFLTALVHGLRRDLAGTDLDTIVLTLLEPPSAGTAVVLLELPVAEALGGPVPAGSIELSEDGDAGWRITRLVPTTRAR